MCVHSKKDSIPVKSRIWKRKLLLRFGLNRETENKKPGNWKYDYANGAAILANWHTCSKHCDKNPHFFQKFTFSKSHFTQNSHFPNIIFHKIHIYKISLFTKFTFSKSHFSKNSHFLKSQFSQNSQFLNLIFHKIHNSEISIFTEFTFLRS